MRWDVMIQLSKNQNTPPRWVSSLNTKVGLGRQRPGSMFEQDTEARKISLEQAFWQNFVKRVEDV